MKPVKLSCICCTSCEMMDPVKYAGNMCIFGGPYSGYQNIGELPPPKKAAASQTTSLLVPPVNA